MSIGSVEGAAHNGSYLLRAFAVAVAVADAVAVAAFCSEGAPDEGCIPCRVQTVVQGGLDCAKIGDRFFWPGNHSARTS